MILYTNTANTVFVTATELQTLTSPYFLFELSSEQSNTITRFIASNISSNTTRYDKFVITLTGSSSVNLSAATINLDATGWYNYKIYEQSTATNFQVTGTTSLLEEGKCLVTGTTSDINYISSPVTVNYISPNF